MNSPLILFTPYLPIEIIFYIQRYVSNDFVITALQEYYRYLYYKKTLYEDFVFNQYIRPTCRCYTRWNSIANRMKTRDCWRCTVYDSTSFYIPSDFRMCIEDNPQFMKISYGNKVDYQEYLDKDFDYTNTEMMEPSRFH